jgi:hypothetical protein
MLEKYRKLAHDAHLNGDRVQEEYYLQFADHYFRVLADQKQRQDDARQRRDERSPDGADSGRSEEPRYRDYDDYGDDAEDNSSPTPSANDRDQSAQREQSSHSEEESPRSDNEAVYEPAQNPFVRDNSAVRNAAKPRKPRRPAREAGPEGDDGNTPELNLGVDPSVLPPSIGAERTTDEPEAEAKPRRRTRKPKAAEDKSADDSGEKLEPVV